MTIDASGNVYVTGVFSGIIDFDPGPSTYTLNGLGNLMYITKQDPAGNLVWAKSFGVMSGITEKSQAMTVDPLGNIIIAGYFAGPGDFDPGPGTFMLYSSAGMGDAFILKLDANGNFIWAKCLSGTADGVASDEFVSIDTDALGNIYALGDYYDTLDADPGPGVYLLTNAILYADVFVAKYDPSGNFIWAKSFDASADMGSNGLCLGPKGDVFVSGIFGLSCDFDPGPGVFTMTAQGNSSDIFLVKLSSAGNLLWARQFSGPNRDEQSSIALDATGNTFISGIYFGSIDTDPGPAVVTVSTTAPYSPATFITKVDPNGNYVWSRGINGPKEVTAYALDLDNVANVHVAGRFQQTVDFDPGPGMYNLTVFGGGDVFLLRLDSNGVFLTAQQMGGTGYESGRGLLVGPGNEIIINGEYLATGDYDPSGTVYNLYLGTDFSDVFVVKLLANVATSVSAYAFSADLSVFPNPASDFLFVKAPAGAFVNFTIRILSVEGKEMMRIKNSNENSIFSIDLGNLTEGYYIFEALDADAGTKRVPFVIARP